MDPQTFAQLSSNAESNYKTLQKTRAAQKPQPQKKKGPGGLEGFLINSLPAITSGVGAVGGSFLAPGAGTVAGGAAGGALGEVLKRKLLGENQDLGQTAVQGIEGGALAGVGSAFKGVKAGATALTKLGTGTAEKEAASTAEKSGSSFLKNLTTQGQQAQGRVTGVSAGSKAAGNELVPQDTERMLQTLKDEGINTGNANNTLRDVADKQKQYGKQIADHFKANNAPLKSEDTKVIADNYIAGLKTTDPAVLKQAQVIADDLQRNVKDTKSLWEFRKQLDSRIPDTKFGDEATTAKIAALKDARQYITSELGSVPGASNYHDLSEIKPFVSAEAKRLNNPGGGIVGRVLSSGPVQKGESLLGKTTEKIGQAGQGTPQAVDTMAPEALANGTTPNFMQKLVGAVATPIANPGKTAGAVIKQEAGRGFGLPAAVAANGQQAAADTTTEPDISQALIAGTASQPDTSSDPFSSENVQANVQQILAQGGKMKDVSDYLSNVKAYQDLVTPTATATSSKPSAQQYGLAQSGYQSLQKLSKLLEDDPSIVNKNATPGQGTPLVGSLISNAAGASNYHALADNILSSLIHLQTGATATKEEMTAAHGQLPQPGDSAEERQNKINTLLSNFQPFLSYGSSGSSSDLQSLLDSAGL